MARGHNPVSRHKQDEHTRGLEVGYDYQERCRRRWRSAGKPDRISGGIQGFRRYGVAAKRRVRRAKPKFEQLRQTYLATLEAMKSDPAAYCRGLADTPELSVDEIEQLKQRAQQAFESIVFTTSYEAAAKDADLVIEAIAEDPKQKDAFYAELAKYLPESTILVTNSSTLLPSQIAASTGRPEKFLALHFANRIWRNNTAEVMGHPGTDQAAYDEVVRFAADLGMVPLQLHKEQPGYILNSKPITVQLEPGKCSCRS